MGLTEVKGSGTWHLKLRPRGIRPLEPKALEKRQLQEKLSALPSWPESRTQSVKVSPSPPAACREGRRLIGELWFSNRAGGVCGINPAEHQPLATISFHVDFPSLNFPPVEAPSPPHLTWSSL